VFQSSLNGKAIERCILCLIDHLLPLECIVDVCLRLCPSHVQITHCAYFSFSLKRRGENATVVKTEIIKSTNTDGVFFLDELGKKSEVHTA
jgi:hypothetical protein